jgi:hypothetical protein
MCTVYGIIFGDYEDFDDNCGFCGILMMKIS